LANEYVWGTNIILATNSGSLVPVTAGTINEVSSITGAGLCAYGVATNINRGPLRCGFAASAISTRSVAGSTYYGVMEMAGNVTEQCIGGYNGYDYSAFATINGDGILTVAGIADTPNWPVLGGGNGVVVGEGGGVCRGGDWYDNGGEFCITSNRDWTTSNANQTRDNRVGGRGVRTP
jgi:hypothetical protein